MIVTAIETQNPSCNKGAIPNTVVAAALTTGLNLDSKKQGIKNRNYA